MPIEQDDFSRFKGTQTVIKNGIETFGLWSRPFFLKAENLNNEEIITLKIDQSLAGRPDLISQQLYQTPFYDWVIIMFNRPSNPLNWPPAGSVIKTPTTSIIYRMI